MAQFTGGVARLLARGAIAPTPGTRYRWLHPRRPGDLACTGPTASLELSASNLNSPVISRRA